MWSWVAGTMVVLYRAPAWREQWVLFAVETVFFFPRESVSLLKGWAWLSEVHFMSAF